MRQNTVVYKVHLISVTNFQGITVRREYVRLIDRGVQTDISNSFFAEKDESSPQMISEEPKNNLLKTRGSSRERSVTPSQANSLGPAQLHGKYFLTSSVLSKV